MKNEKFSKKVLTKKTQGGLLQKSPLTPKNLNYFLLHQYRKCKSFAPFRLEVQEACLPRIPATRRTLAGGKSRARTKPNVGRTKARVRAGVGRGAPRPARRRAAFLLELFFVPIAAKKSDLITLVPQ